MKDTWTEEKVLNLAQTEHSSIERKSGKLLEEDDWRGKLAKAVSAMANTGGGTIILGVDDAGKPDGVPLLRGKQPVREWLEQVLPALVTPSLSHFRIHEVPPTPCSIVSGDRGLLVIEMDDSPIAPHQSTHDHYYYYRVGSHSKPAPHFWLETLRNRVVKPSFASSGTKAFPVFAYQTQAGLYVQVLIMTYLTNIGTVMARYVCLDARYSKELLPEGVILTKDMHFKYVGPCLKLIQRPLSYPLLPGMSAYMITSLNLLLPDCNGMEQLQTLLQSIYSKGLSVDLFVLFESGATKVETVLTEKLSHEVSLDSIIHVQSRPAGSSTPVGYGIVVNSQNVNLAKQTGVLTAWLINNSSITYRDLTLLIRFVDARGTIVHREDKQIEVLGALGKKAVDIHIIDDISAADNLQYYIFPGLDYFERQVSELCQQVVMK